MVRTSTITIVFSAIPFVVLGGKKLKTTEDSEAAKQPTAAPCPGLFVWLFRWLEFARRGIVNRREIGTSPSHSKPDSGCLFCFSLTGEKNWTDCGSVFMF